MDWDVGLVESVVEFCGLWCGVCGLWCEAVQYDLECHGLWTCGLWNFMAWDVQLVELNVLWCRLWCGTSWIMMWCLWAVLWNLMDFDVELVDCDVMFVHCDVEFDGLWCGVCRLWCGACSLVCCDTQHHFLFPVSVGFVALGSTKIQNNPLWDATANHLRYMPEIKHYIFGVLLLEI